ncbi:hypothetical protein ACFC1R_04275 [Kitasatospora sp. NPDC056138]|uniref:hypothetical protein n=1 Tax=Kitasatospora sp. NPDC056138 TaxID=3345724 RepID=UPI0035E14645
MTTLGALPWVTGPPAATGLPGAAGSPEPAAQRVAFARVALQLPSVSATARLVEEHLSVGLDSPATDRWRPLADVLHSERPDTVEEAVSRARWELRRHPGCRVATVRTADGAVLAATAARTLHLVAVTDFGHLVGSLLHTWLASGLAIPPVLALSAEPDPLPAEPAGADDRCGPGGAGDPCGPAGADDRCGPGGAGGAAQPVSLRWGGDPPGRAAIRSVIRSRSGPGMDS